MTRCLVCSSSYDPEVGHSEADCRVARVDASLAKQLQASMERNARMVNRLQRLQKYLSGDWSTGGVVSAEHVIAAIIRDEEPTW